MTLKQRIKFSLQGKPYLKIITILLSAVAFALCAIASTGYTNDNADYLARALINYSIPFTIVQYDHNDNSIGEMNILSQDVIDIFEDAGIDYLYGYTSSFSSEARFYTWPIIKYIFYVIRNADNELIAR